MAEDKDTTDSEMALASLGFSNNEMLTDYLESLTRLPDSPEKEEKLRILFQAYPELQAIAGEDVALGNRWLQTKMPEGRQVGARYVAADPLEFLSSALRQGVGAYERKSGLDKLRSLADEKTEGVMDIGRNAAAYRTGSPENDSLDDYRRLVLAAQSNRHDQTPAPVAAQVQPAIAQAAKKEVVEEAYDDLMPLKAAALRSQAQQQQAANAPPADRRPQLQMMPSHTQGVDYSDFQNRGSGAYIVPKQKQIPIGYRRY